VYLIYFYRFGYWCVRNYQIWWRFDNVLTKTSWVIFLAHPVFVVCRVTYAGETVNCGHSVMTRPMQSD